MKTTRLSILMGVLLVSLVLVSGALAAASTARATTTPAGLPWSPTTEWTLEGRVYEGNVGDETQPLAGVTVGVYGSNSPYPAIGEFIRSVTTNATGWYGLIVYDDDGAFDYYHILETDPACYTSVGATTVSGTVRTSNWIEYASSLEGKTLTGNKFWDHQPVVTVTPESFISVTAYVNVETTYPLTIAHNDYQPLDFEIQELPPLTGGLSWVSEAPISGTISGPGEAEIDVTFHCTETRDYTGTLLVVHDAPCVADIDVPIVLHCLESPSPGWTKWVGGVEWSPDLVVTAETSDTIQVVDVLTTLPFDSLKLVERWNPGRLKLLDYQVEPAGTSVVPGTGELVWLLPEGGPQVFTMTKWFHVEPCTWTETILREELWVGAELREQRPILITKAPPELWIDSIYDPEVYAGEVATFTLSYGNNGGYENGVWIRNEFPPEAPYVWSDPPADDWAADGAWAMWIVGDLGSGDTGEILVGAAIADGLPPSTTIEIWDWIYDHVNQEWDSTTITFHVQEPPDAEWAKWVNGDPWTPELLVTAETSDTIHVVDVVVTSLAFNLAEFWNSEELELVDWALDPPIGTLISDTGMLEWQVPAGAGVVTMTKLFHVKPCTWEMTFIEEFLAVEGTPEPLMRLVPIEKRPPELWIDSVYDPDVFVGEPAVFTLNYGNGGGREFGAWIRNVFPDIAPFVESAPPPTRVGPAGRWAEWDIELLEMGQRESIEVVVGIAHELPPSTTIEIWDGIFNHAGELMDETVTFFHVPPPPVTFPEGDWPWYAQEEISVDPEPPIAGHPTQLCAEVVNNDPVDPHPVTIEFSVANFGIGLPFTPVGHANLVVPPGSLAKGCIIWVPPTPGHWCIQIRLIGERFPYMISQRNVDVDEPLKPNTPHSRAFPVGNPAPPDSPPVTITLGLIPHLPDWGLELSADVLPNVAPGEIREVILTVTPPADLPPDGQPIVDVEAYVGDKLIGGFRKIFRPPVPLHPFPDPPYAEREISIQPYPPRAGEPTEVCVELRNPTPDPQDVIVQFSWAHFGIGLPFTPISGPRLVHLPPHSIVKECIHWIPPFGGQVCLQVELFMEGYHPQRSRLNLDVNEPLRPGVPHARVFPVGNPAPPDSPPVTITLGLIPHLPDWGLELSADVLPNVAPGETRPVTLTVTPPADLPPDGQPIVDVEAFVGEKFIGGFRKIFRPPVPIHRPGEPVYSESEISIEPYPPRAGEPTHICAKIRNHTGITQTVQVDFSVANFGIGIPFMSIAPPISVELPPFSEKELCVNYIFSYGGHFCVQVTLQADGYPEVFSQRNLDVDEVLKPGQPDQFEVPIGNPFDHPVTITLGLVNHTGWEVSLSDWVLPNVPPWPASPVPVTVWITPSQEVADMGDGAPVIDLEAYVDNELIGGIRKIFRPPVPIHRPRDPIYAETEIGVDPYPVIPGQPTRLSVEVRNPTSQDRVVTATFSIAPFGIGLPFSANHIAPNPIQIFVPAHGAARGHVIWTPPHWRGKFCVRVTLEIEGYSPIWSQRNIDVGEPLRRGEPHSLVFPVGGWPHTEPVTISLGLINHRPGWGVSLSEDTLVNVQPGQPVSVTLIVTPPHNALLGTGGPIVDVEAFVDGEFIGGFRKLDRPPIPLHKLHEKGYAESEIGIDPYPPRRGQETRVSAVLQNTGDTTATVNLEFGWAEFGMGIPFTTTGMVPYTRSVTLSPAMTSTEWVTWTPSHSGHQCVLVRLTDPDGQYEPQQSQRNVDVAERPPCGVTKVFTFTVYNNSPFTATVAIGLITFDVPADWEVTVVPSGTLELGPYSEGVVTVKVKIPCPLTLQAMRARQEMYRLQEEAGGVPTIDVEGYIGGELVGGIEIQLPAGIEGVKLYLPLVLKG